MKVKERHIWVILFSLYIASVAYLCFMKTDDLPSVKPDLFGIPTDKVAHFLMFFPYPVMAYGVFRRKEKKLGFDMMTLAAAYATGIGLAIGTEYVQGLMEYRSCDINDFKADILGISCSAAAILIYIMATIKKRIK